MTSEPAPRRSVKIVVAVWGASYIDRFLHLGLASMAAPGNLPAVAGDWDVEFVVLTSAAEFDRFQDPALAGRFEQFGRLRLVAIDDLIAPGVFTVTLTLAYMRGMRIFGAGMTQSHFIFWNADFVLSDGALTYLSARIAEGRDVVLAGSIRAVSEEVWPVLMARVDDAGVLALNGREMTRLALDHPHALQEAKTVNQPGPWAQSPNHMFWTVGSDAMVARYWQIFMLCLRPSRPVSAIDGYCDYSFVPALCPDQAWLVVPDSDDLCLLEMQERDQAHEPVHHGPDREAQWREDIAEWCTREHLETARAPIVFHAGEAPIEACETISASADYVAGIAAEVGERPGHAGHYYWVSGVSVWNQRRPGREGGDLPPELDRDLPLRQLHHPSFARIRRAAAQGAARRRGVAGALWRLVFGDATGPRALHPDRSALRLLSTVALAVRARLRRRGDGGLVVAPPASWIDRILPSIGAPHFHIDPAACAVWRLRPDPGVSEALIYLPGHDLSCLPQIVANALSVLEAGGRLTLMLHCSASAPGLDPAALETVAKVFSAAGLRDAALRTASAGGLERAYARLVARLIDPAGLRRAAGGGPPRDLVAAIWEIKL